MAWHRTHLQSRGAPGCVRCRNIGVSRRCRSKLYRRYSSSMCALRDGSRRMMSRSPCQRISSSSVSVSAKTVAVRGILPNAAVSPKSCPSVSWAVFAVSSTAGMSWRKMWTPSRSSREPTPFFSSGEGSARTSGSRIRVHQSATDRMNPFRVARIRPSAASGNVSPPPSTTRTAPDRMMNAELP